MPESELPKPYDVGVLFVHGIGEQGRGETLVACGEPVCAWIQDWIDGLRPRWIAAGMMHRDLSDWIREAQAKWVGEGIGPSEMLRRLDALRPLQEAAPLVGASRGVGLTGLAGEAGTSVVAGKADMTDASVRPRNDAEAAPSNASVRVSVLRANGDVTQSHWLLAEGWWATTFAAPRFQDLAKLGLAIFPWVILSHFGLRQRRSVERSNAAGPSLFRAIKKALDAVAAFLLSLLLLVVSEAVMLALLVIALPPIPWLRNLVASLQRKAAAIIGDSYVLLTSPIQAAAMVGQVRRDLAWLAERCEAVAVVAHSQGAAVSFEALQKGFPPELRLICTYGSGLRKLTEIRMALQPDTQLYKVVGMANASALGALGALSVLLYTGRWGPLEGFMVSFSLLALLSAYLQSMARESLAHLTAWGDLFDMSGVRWIDLFASADPVPHGPLFDSEIQPKTMQSRPVHNEALVWSDHTTYWKNRDEFIAAVAPAIASLGPVKLDQLSEGDEPALKEAASRRQARVKYRLDVRMRALVLTALVSLSLALPLIPPGVSFVRAVGDAMLRAGGRLFKEIPDWKGWAWTGAVEALGLAAFLMVSYLVYRFVVRSGWNRWDRKETDLLFARSTLARDEQAYRTYRWRMIGFSIGLLTFGLGVLALTWLFS